jgi:hypothetical protein
MAERVPFSQGPINPEKGEVTAAGPSPILTGFPSKLKMSIRTPASIKKNRIECQGKNKKFETLSLG